MKKKRPSLEQLVSTCIKEAIRGLGDGRSVHSVIEWVVNHAARWGADASQPSLPSGWRPMSSAPKDGTMILVTETPNGEHWNVVPASFMAYGADNVQPNTDRGRWWGIDTAYWRGDEGPLPVRFKPLAISPVCWQPFPIAEPESKLNRRMASMKE